MPRLNQGVVAVEVVDVGPEPVDVITVFGLEERAPRLGPFDRHAVREAVAVGKQVCALDRGAVDTGHGGRAGDGRLDDEHRLGRTEPPEGGERRQIGSTAVAGDPHVRDEVAVGGVKQAALENGRRQVCGRPCVLEEGHLVGDDLPCRVEADPKVGRVWVAFAGDRHVLLAAENDPHRPAGGGGRQCRQHRPRRRLVLLAAEGAAKADHVHLHGVHRKVEHPGGDPLHCGRGLGGGEQSNPVALLGNRHRRLGLEVEVLLATGIHPAVDDRVAVGPRPIDVAALQGPRGGDQAAEGERLPGVVDSGLFLDLDGYGGGSQPRLGHALGHHQRHRLADEMDLAIGQQGLVLDDAADLILARDVVCRQHGHHTRQSLGGGDVDPEVEAVGHR